MFERFTDRARRVVVLAQEEARLMWHNYIGTEHLLLGLLHEGEGVAAKALVAAGVSLDRVRLTVESVAGRGSGAPEGHIPFTPRCKKVLELSLREAQALGHSYIGTEHILLGLLSEGNGLGAAAIASQNVELADMRQRVIDILGAYGQPAEQQRNDVKFMDVVCDLLAIADGVVVSEVGRQWVKVEYEGQRYRVIVSPL